MREKVEKYGLKIVTGAEVRDILDEFHRSPMESTDIAFAQDQLRDKFMELLDQAIQSAVKEAKSEIAEKIQHLFKSDYSVTKNQLKDLLK